ncbi:uncharacterized protein I303_103482 [Kwoniella dejecticola CBS 10117]|uniref:Uncharacterized protein n=1 Tax=Kwoniella dejecticola CBS 10117 TaxID=1296121 RepID=A0A1A6A6V2_9TREE|nr:uncharacterized protein I303_03505 [Kwoniella dejecticola CBS 10117]OBR85792.1 hypothetical protein I303_03505 [Kwoniella dejecticola CBS 10117]
MSDSPRSFAEVMSIPPLSPSSSFTSSALDTPSPARLVFFPHPHSQQSDFDSSGEEDVFASPISASRSLPKNNTRYASRKSLSEYDESDFGGATSIPISSLGLGGIDRLPDEPIYPQASSYGEHGPNTTSAGKQTSSSQRFLLDQSATPDHIDTLMPSPIINSHEGSPMKEEKRKLPFGHSFLAPLPAASDAPQPLVPMRFMSYTKPPPSSWRSPQLYPQTPKRDREMGKAHRSPTSPLRRTDSETLLPDPPYNDNKHSEQELLKRPVHLNGHMRKKSNDSEMTIKLGDGFAPLHLPQDRLGQVQQPLQHNIHNQEHSSIFNYGHEVATAPNMPRHASHQVYNNTFQPTGGRYRSSSTSHVLTKPTRPTGPSSPYQPFASSPLIDGRPSSPIPFAMDEDYAESHTHSHQYSHQGLGLGLGMNPVDSSTIGRFPRPVSPTFPEDLLTPHTPNTYTHQTLSSAPKRPKSPTTARESLNAVLIRHPSSFDADDDDEREDSLDRLVQATQRFESGSSYLPRTPPKSPPSQLSILSSSPSQSSSTKPIRPKVKRGFPILKSLFPPSPPPSTPSLRDQTGPRPQLDREMHLGMVQRKDERFDVDVLSERLRAQQGRISFAELEGFGQTLADEEEQRQDLAELKNHEQLRCHDSNGSRPSSGRRWTLPF